MRTLTRDPRAVVLPVEPAELEQVDDTIARELVKAGDA
jgi:hypothetical protein